MGDVIPMQDPREQIERIECQLDEMQKEFGAKIHEIVDEWAARRAPLEAKLKALKQRYLDPEALRAELREVDARRHAIAQQREVELPEEQDEELRAESLGLLFRSTDLREFLKDWA